MSIGDVIGWGLALWLVTLVVRAVRNEIAEERRLARLCREADEAWERFMAARTDQLRQEIEEASGQRQRFAESPWVRGKPLDVPNLMPLRRPKELTDPDRLAMIRAGRING